MVETKKKLYFSNYAAKFDITMVRGVNTSDC